RVQPRSPVSEVFRRPGRNRAHAAVHVSDDGLVAERLQLPRRSPDVLAARVSQFDAPRRVDRDHLNRPLDALAAGAGAGEAKTRAGSEQRTRVLGRSRDQRPPASVCRQIRQRCETAAGGYGDPALVATTILGGVHGAAHRRMSEVAVKWLSTVPGAKIVIAG